MASEHATSKREELMEKLATEVETLKTSQGWQKWMATAARFHKYSLNNQLLIVAQRPDATSVAGFNTWKSLGRAVKTGEKGIAIVAPTRSRLAEQTQPVSSDVEDCVKTVTTGFRVVYVFDVSQTQGEPLAEMAWPILDVDGCEELFESLCNAVGVGGFELRLVGESKRGDCRGWYRGDDRSISIVDTYPTADKCATLLHELAHGLDPRCNGGRSASRAERELIAESVAYIVGERLGLPVGDAATYYVATWGADTNGLERIAADALLICGQLEGLITKVTERVPA